VQTLELSVHPLVSLIHKENLGDPHPVFAGGEAYVSHRFVAEAERELRAELASAGLGDRDRLADFTGMLSVIQRARTEFYGWVIDNQGAYAILAAAHGRSAFALTRRDDRVTFQRVGADRLAEAILEQLPDIPPARAESFSVREAEMTSTAPRPVLRKSSGPVRSEQAKRLDALLRAARSGGAKLYAASRDEDGHRIRSRAWLDLIDLPDGRWAVHLTTRGERTINAAPATAAFVAARLTDLLRTAN
jgi:ESX secretion-associated protein EspG